MTDPIDIELRSGSIDHRFAMDACQGRDYIVSLIRKSGLAAYEEPFPEFLAAVLLQGEGAMIDIGANTGLYSLLAASLSPTQKVYAFEPVKAIADVLETNIGLNPDLAGRLQLHRIALSDLEGEALIHETGNAHGFIATTSTLDRDFSRTQTINKTYLVPTTTLDSFVSENGIDDVSFIKIDVEGHEKPVMIGGEATILSRRPFLAVEMLSWSAFDFFDAFLEENGYIDGVLRPGSLRFATRAEYVSDGWNHVLIPEEKAEFAARCAAGIGLRVLD